MADNRLLDMYSDTFYPLRDPPHKSPTTHSTQGELLINNSSVEKAVSYLLLLVFQNKYYNLFALINFYLGQLNAFFLKYSDQFRFLGNCPPTPPLRQHFGLSKK